MMKLLHADSLWTRTSVDGAPVLVSLNNRFRVQVNERGTFNVYDAENVPKFRGTFATELQAKLRASQLMLEVGNARNEGAPPATPPRRRVVIETEPRGGERHLAWRAFNYVVAGVPVETAERWARESWDWQAVVAMLQRGATIEQVEEILT